MNKLVTLICFCSILLTACGTESDSRALNSGRTDIANLQESFRQKILSQFDEVAQPELVIAEVASPEDIKTSALADSPELKAWRAEIADTWSEIPSDKLDFMCEIFFQGLVDEASNLAYIFVQARQQFAREGTVIHSITNIKMREDNRKTIQFPTAKYSTSLFVCSSQITLKLSNGYYSQPLDSTLTWNYYLDGSEKKFTFTFKV